MRPDFRQEISGLTDEGRQKKAQNMNNREPTNYWLEQERFDLIRRWDAWNIKKKCGTSDFSVPAFFSFWLLDSSTTTAALRALKKLQITTKLQIKKKSVNIEIIVI